MKYEWMDAFLLEKQGVKKDYKEEWNWDRYMIEDKMFVALCYNDDRKPELITLKLEPVEGEVLRQNYDDIIPGYYMNKTHWNSIKYNGEISDEMLKDLLEKSYDLVLRGFSKKKQKEILGE